MFSLRHKPKSEFLSANHFFTNGWRSMEAGTDKQPRERMGPCGNHVLMEHLPTYQPIPESLIARVKNGEVGRGQLMYKEMNLQDGSPNPFRAMLGDCAEHGIISPGDYCITEKYDKPFTNCLITKEALIAAAASHGVHFGLRGAPGNNAELRRK
jgi:hypothetical protein